jgi:2-keto-3-deoxy-L-rhamnonate aldolase RhmA
VKEVSTLIDRLTELLNHHRILYGIICRDPTFVDVELLAHAGYHIVFIDLEHGPISATDAIRLGRTVTHLGMVPMVRIIELSRGNVQGLLDGGFQIMALPNITDANQATEFVGLGKFPPVGRRGVSTSSASTNYALGEDPQSTFVQANKMTHLMVMFENDQSFAQLDSILRVDGIDLVTVGPLDWAVSLGRFGDDGKTLLANKIEKVIAAARAAGKVVAMGASSVDEAKHYVSLGARILFLGVDVPLKRKAFVGTLTAFQEAVGL